MGGPCGLLMLDILLADLVVVIHVGFVVFVVFGGLLVWRWPWVAWFHVPAVCWGVGIEWMGGMCPLTPLENWLRSRAGESTYETDFVVQYLLPFLYPTSLTRSAQFVLGSAVLAVNVLAYALHWRRHQGGAM